MRSKHWSRRALVAVTLAAGALLALVPAGPTVLGKWIWLH